MDPTLPGLVPSSATLLDERGRPDFRDVFGALAARSDRISTAVTRVRLSTLDLKPDELERIVHFRVLVAELNALTLDAEARLIQADQRRAPRIERFRKLLEEGRLEVRSAPLAGWSPDFSVFWNGPTPHSVLAGFHWFERPFPHRGPALAALHHGDAARLAAHRHEELWARAHDVGPAVWSILSKAERSARALRASTG
jgi:hypothetical protein